MAPSLAWTVPGTWPAKNPGANRRDSVSATPDALAVDARATLAELSEAALIDACLAGRPGAFDLVVERHRRAVYQLCYRFVGNHEDASDLHRTCSCARIAGCRVFTGAPRWRRGCTASA